MPTFVDPRTGEVFANVPDDEQERARREFGLVSEDEYDHQIAVKEADQGIGGAISTGFQRGLGHVQDIARSVGLQGAPTGGDAFGPGGGLLPMGLGADAQAPPVAPLPPAGAETFPGGFDESARLQREAHPIASGIGTGLASAPFAAIAGAAGGALGGPAVLGAGLLGVGAEAAVEGVAQEYDDAWFEQRPFELKNVVGNTLMFGGLDFAFRGAFKGLGAAFGGKPKSALGSRNVVSEAQGAAREFVEPVGGGSVGAARAADLEEPFVDAIAQMPDSQAMVLARDADDHLHLVSQDASESFTRLNNSLSDDLGNQLKYEDIGTYAQELEPKTLERQAQWWTSVSEDADAAARRINALADGDTTALDFGNLGKKATQTIDDFNRRISETVDPGQRMILVDEFKKRLDKLTLSIDASHSVDAETRKSLKELIAPTRETLRKGLESKKLFGGAADLQKALNKPWHGLLEHWREVQDTLTQKTGHIEFDVSGAGRITRESTVDRMRSVLGKDPRSNQEFGRHLTGVLENLQGLIDARQAYGIARKDGLDAVEQDIRNMMEDWNLAQTIGTARNRVDAMKANPRNIMQRVLNIGETLPMVGKPIQTARTLGEVLQDIHLDPKTPIGRVWDTAYKRFAQNTAFQDPVIISNYRPWVADALKARGGKFQPPAPPTGAVGSPAMPGMPPANANAQRSVAQPGLSAAVQEYGPRALGAGGLFGAAAAEDSPEGSSLAATAGLALLFPKGLMRGKSPAFKRMVRVVSPIPAEKLDMPMLTRIAEMARKDLPNDADYAEFMGVITDHFDNPKLAKTGAVDFTATPISGAAGATSGGMFRGSDGVERYIKFVSDKMARSEAANASAYADFGVGNLPLEVGEQDGRSLLMSKRLGKEWKTVDQLMAEGAPMSPQMAREYVRGVPADVVLGNWDVAGNGGNIMTDGTRMLRIDAGEAGPHSLGNAGVKVFDLKEEWSRFQASFYEATRKHLTDNPQSFRGPGDMVPMAGIDSTGAVKQELLQSISQIDAAFERAGGTAGYVKAKYPHLSAREQNSLTAAFTKRLDFLKKNVAGFAAIVAGAGWALEDTAAAAEPPPQQAPEHAYRDALREIEQAGQMQVRTLATDALKRKPPRGKDRDPLTLFAGKRSIQDAVEETRERLDEIAADPSTLLEQLGGSAGDLGKTHPTVYSAYVQKATQVAMYLQSVIPKRTATTLLDTRGGALSFDRAWDYAARFVGATQPRVALREVVRGTAPPEMIEALQENWGEELWDPFRIEMMGQVQRMHDAGRHIPSERLRRWDSLLGLNGQLDPSASLDVAAHFIAAQDAELAKRQQAGQQTGAMPSSGQAGAQFRTKLAAVAAERQAV